METGKELQLQTQTNQLLSKTELEFAVKVNDIIEVTKTIALQTNPIIKGLMQANAMEQINKLITPELMKPVEKLFGTAMGIRTDKDYPPEVKKRIFIEATLGGWGVVGNQINVIGGNMYIAKNGYLPRLRSYPGLKFTYPFKHQLPEQDAKYGTWSVTSKIEYELNGKKEIVVITNPTKKNDGQSADALWGKADTKCCRWLWNKVTGENTMDDSGGDEEFTEAHVVSSELKSEVKSEPIKKQEEVKSEVSKELQEKFDNYIAKAISNEDLIVKAKTWCGSTVAKNAGITFSIDESGFRCSLNMAKFNEMIEKFKVS